MTDEIRHFRNSAQTHQSLKIPYYIHVQILNLFLILESGGAALPFNNTCLQEDKKQSSSESVSEGIMNTWLGVMSLT